MIEKHVVIARAMRRKRLLERPSSDWPSGGFITFDADFEKYVHTTWGKSPTASGTFYSGVMHSTSTAWSSSPGSRITMWGGSLVREETEYTDPDKPIEPTIKKAIKKPSTTPPHWAIDVNKHGVHKSKKKR